MSEVSVLIVEDHEWLCVELAEFLRSRGYLVRTAASILEAEQALADPCDLLVLDINLPDGNGLDFCRKIRPYVRAGIVMFTGRSETSVKVQSLKDGADAYLIKPVNTDELEATLISVYRRLGASERGRSLISSPMPPVFRLDSKVRSLYLPNKAVVELTAGECFFLNCLFASKNHEISREALSLAYENAGQSYSETKIENVVSRLRRKVNSVAQQHLPISSVYGKGYAFRADGRVL